jgi:Zn-dependent alcohol dehydrogenase
VRHTGRRDNGVGVRAHSQVGDCGCEGVGVVTAVGNGVADFAVGDAVVRAFSPVARAGQRRRRRARRCCHRAIATTGIAASISGR